MAKYALIICILLVVAFFLAADAELFERLYHISREYEAYELDEVFSVIILFSGFLLIFSFYMNYRLTGAVRRRKIAEHHLEELNHELEDRVRQRTRELDRANVQLRQEMDERARIESRLLQKQKMEAVGTMAGGIAHDFNTILGIIMGYAGMIQTHADGSAGIRSMGEEILDAARRSKALISQLQDFTTPDQMEKTVMDFRGVVRDGIKLLDAAVGPHAGICPEFPGHPCPVKVNAQQITRVILNLGLNAVHAMDNKGEIGICLEQVSVSPITAKANDVRPGDFFALVVSDTGCGISPGVLGNIFDPFFTTKNVGDGSGLGLSVVFGIVRAHGGYVDVTSEPGKGTRFRVILPQALPVTAQNQTESGE
ncbi:MAG: ATP-binding protein [Desulfobacter sp.]